MKRTLFAALAISLIACQSNPKPTETTTTVSNPITPDTVTVVPEHVATTQPQTTEQEQTTKTVAHKSQTAHKIKSSSQVEGKSTEQSTAANSQTQSGTASSETNNTAETKKGWSKTAKGAVIGGVVGAGAGAVIDKNNRAAGAVIGAAVGAGAGAIIGNQMDKKDGRH